MSESNENGMSIQNTCYECMVIARDSAQDLPVGKCQTCLETEEATADTNAWNLHEDDRLGEGPGLTTSHTDEPSASDWVSSKTISVHQRSFKTRMIERWSDDNPFHLEELRVEFIDNDEIEERSEFLPPIAQLIDGGVYEELWELEDFTQRQRERECQWCHILTPKIFNDCQSCDKPLENNLI
jgi:hypothetical protein